MKLERFNIETAEEKIDFRSMHDRCLVDVNKHLPPPPIALSLGNYWHKGELNPIPFGTYGNFSCLVGASKSFKTFLKSALLAGYIGGRSNTYFPDLRGHDVDKKFVIDIDTEQSLWHTQNVAKRVCEMVGSDYNYFRTFSTREDDAKTRFQFIEWIMMESEYRNQIGLITIDGAADIIDSVNDLDEANKIVQGMMTWTTKSGAHIATVLHKNPGSEKPTGHLGSAIMKKAETVAFVIKEDDMVRVTPELTRNYPFKEFVFKINDNHLPEVEEKETFL